MLFDGRIRFATGDNFNRRRLRLKGPDFPALSGGRGGHRMRPENAERISVVTANYRFDFFVSHEGYYDRRASKGNEMNAKRQVA
jgi:hypothetical protein